jgi:hypothetical protein
MSPSRWTSAYRSSATFITSDVPAVQAVMKAGDVKPHDSTIKRTSDAFSVRQGGTASIAAPTVATAAAEFSVARTGSGPWTVTVTWIGAALTSLARGVYSRTITLTSAGAANSPLSVPVRIEVL